MNNTLEEKKACLWHVAFSVVYLEGLTCVFEKNYFGIYPLYGDTLVFVHGYHIVVLNPMFYYI